MLEILDIVGKELEKDKECVFLNEGKLFKGIIKAFNKDSYVKIQESITSKNFIIKNSKKEIYQFPEEIDLNEIFETNAVQRVKKPTQRDFLRELSSAKDILNNGIIDGDKVLFINFDALEIGRTINLVKDKKTLTINSNPKKNDVVIEADGTNIYLLKQDYYIKEKSAYE